MQILCIMKKSRRCYMNICYFNTKHLLNVGGGRRKLKHKDQIQKTQFLMGVELPRTSKGLPVKIQAQYGGGGNEYLPPIASCRVSANFYKLGSCPL